MGWISSGWALEGMEIGNGESWVGLLGSWKSRLVVQLNLRNSNNNHKFRPANPSKFPLLFLFPSSDIVSTATLPSLAANWVIHGRSKHNLDSFLQEVSHTFDIIMNQNPQASDNFFLSPLLHEQQDNSPYLSPFGNPYHPHHAELDDLIDFRLDGQPFEQRMHVAEQLEIVPLGKREKFTELEAAEDSSEAVSPANSPCEAPPTIHAEAKDHDAPPSLFLGPTIPHEDSDIIAMIEFLVDHSQMKDDALDVEGRRISAGDPCLFRVFRLLANKFRKLRKTKEEMTKYCLRKAFKFIAARRSSQARDLDHCLREYFEDAGGSFSIPFKKHSSEKTMNVNFLKRIFACQKFTDDFRVFLSHFPPMVAEDNGRKVRYLASLVQSALQKGEAESVGKIKRLPWTRAILEQVLHLAVSMPEGPQQATSRQSRRRSSSE